MKHAINKKILSSYIDSYLKNHPMFFSYIRPQEAYLFHTHKKLLKTPIVDYGSGDGFFADVVWGKNSIDIGLDMKNTRTLEAETTQVYKKIIYYDGVTIPIQNAAVQTVVSNCVLEHIPDIQNSLSEIYRILRPGGTFITTVMAAPWEEYQAGRKILGTYYNAFMRKRQVHHNVFGSAKWRAQFESAGFAVEEEIGYLSQKNAFWLDVAHYLSIPSLLTRALFKKWVISPAIYSKMGVTDRIADLISIDVPAHRSAAIFYVLKK
jgi:SAM-dependent methyltransferase